MKNGTQSGMKKITKLNKSNQISGSGKKIIEEERKKLLLIGMELAISYCPTSI